MNSIYRDTEHLHARAYLLLLKYQAAGGHTFDGHIPSTTERRLKGEMHRVLGEVEQALKTCDLQDYVLLEPLANMLSLDVYSRQIEFGNRYAGFKRLMNEWLSNGSSTGEEDLITVLSQLQCVDFKAVDDKYFRWAADVKSKWITELKRMSVIERSETWYKRLSILLGDNLWAYFCDGQYEVKKSWSEAFIISGLSGLNLRELTAYVTFLGQAAPFLPSDRAMRLMTEANSELRSRLETLVHNTSRGYSNTKTSGLRRVNTASARL